MIAAVLVCSRRGSCSSDRSCCVLDAVFCFSRGLLGVISRAEYIQLLLASIVYVYMLGHVYNVERPFVGSVTERAIVLKAGFVVSGLLFWLFMV
jgi:hypothetical protein